MRTYETLLGRQSLRTYFPTIRKANQDEIGQGAEESNPMVTYGVEDSHAIRDRARERIAEARAAPEYVIIIGRLPSLRHMGERGVEGRWARVRKSREAYWGERKGNDGGGGGGRRKRECFYCSTSRLKVAFPGQWADPLKPPVRGR